MQTPKQVKRGRQQANRKAAEDRKVAATMKRIEDGLTHHPLTEGQAADIKRLLYGAAK